MFPPLEKDIFSASESYPAIGWAKRVSLGM